MNRALRFTLLGLVVVLAGCGGGGEKDRTVDRAVFEAGSVGGLLISKKWVDATKGEASEYEIHDAVLTYIDELRAYVSETGDEEYVAEELTDWANKLTNSCPSCVATLDRELTKLGLDE